ncbi:MAG: quinone-dependent dihydroorotate dehydrogenase [Salinisphaera sp.]|nr:quinone-dependent dihydroorotate dehydrogenase [Salinisphaera sp.]
MYSLLRPALFSLDAERAHDMTLACLDCAAPVMNRLYRNRLANLPTRLMGLDLPNPVGLAAGLDKTGQHIDGLAALGFGFLEIGTVTPLAQAGNPKPRLFRLPEQRAVLNRFGFNNEGAPALVERVRAARFKGVLGINIGKNKATPADRAVDDYLAALNCVHPVASYVTINISSPNTQGLRNLQGRDSLDTLLGAMVETRNRLDRETGRRTPLAVKIAPDLDADGLDAIVDRLRHHGVDGVIATNTTISRDDVPLRWQAEAGGLSGAPLRQRSTAIIRALHQRLGDEIPIIGVGGISHGRDVIEKMNAGASAVQLYSGLIYRGPGLVRDCVEAAAGRRQP